MPAILKNDDAEALILDVRAGRSATTQAIDDRGAFLVFPTSVVTCGAAGTHPVFPLRTSTEPGALVTDSGCATVVATVAGVRVTGAFHWSLSDAPTPSARYQFRVRGREVSPPPWAVQLPRSQSLTPKGRAALCREQSRLRRRGLGAEHRLLALSEEVIRQSCRGAIRGALRYRPAVDLDDVVQRGLQTASRLLPLYASAARPPSSWLGMLGLDSRRDVHREIFRLDWMPAGSTSAVILAHLCGVTRQADPASTLEALEAGAERLGRDCPRLSAAQLDLALRAPGLVEQQQAAAAVVAGPGDAGAARSAVTAQVARLVSNDATLIDRAATGDPRALTQVGDAVVRRLGCRGDSARLVRRRCWEQFRHSGQLFSGPEGMVRFGHVADPVSLAVIDRSLQRAAGFR